MIEVGSIEETFEISGRPGLTLVPGIKKSELPYPLKAGSEIVIVNPNGSVVETTIFGIEMINTRRPMTHIPFCLPKDISKSSIQSGALIYVRKRVST